MLMFYCVFAADYYNTADYSCIKSRLCLLKWY